MKKIIFLILLFPSLGFAKLNVVTTTTDLAAIANEVGDREVRVESLAKGTQDPHFIEAKPSYMVKIHNADLLISVGLELEVGWLPPIIQGARNPRIQSSTAGYLEVGPLTQVIEVASNKITRREGDVHPDGNPHVSLSPKNAGIIAIKTAEKMGDLDPENKKIYAERALKLKKRLDDKFVAWKKRVEKSGIKNVVTYHKTLNYFLNDFGIVNSANLEPKPGIPPTSKHILDVISIIKKNGIKLILVENYFDSKIADRIKEDIPDVRIVSVPVAVEGAPEIKSVDDLYEKLVQTIEGKK